MITTSENIHFKPGIVQNEEKNTKFFEESQINYIPFQEDSTRDDEEAKINDFWNITGEIIFRYHVEPRVKTVHAERRIISYSDEVHPRYQNNMYITGSIVGKQIEDHWNVDGERKLSDAWTEGKATRRKHMVRGETYEETNNFSS